MLAMLVSMFTVMAFAGDDAPACTHENYTYHPVKEATETEAGVLFAYVKCNSCGVCTSAIKVGDTYLLNWNSAEEESYFTTPATGEGTETECNHDLVFVEETGYAPYAKCKNCGLYFAVYDGEVDIMNPVASKQAFKGVCVHKKITYHAEADGYSAYGQCDNCGKYFSAWAEGMYILADPKDSKEAFKLTPVQDDEAKLTVRISGRGTVKVKIYDEWKTVEDGTKVEDLMPLVKGSTTEKEKLSKDGILSFKATYGSNYSVEWTLNNGASSSKSTFDATLKAGDNTLWVVFTKDSTPSCSHSYVWNYNDTYHWKECKYCGATKYNSKEKHDLYSYTKYGYTYKFCDDCGYDSYTYDYGKHPSSHDSYKYTDLNSTYHLKECKKSGCNYEVKEYHTWIKNTDKKTKADYPYICKYCERLSKTAYTDLPFRDVDGNVWYYDDVLYAYINGYMDGLSAVEFGANQNTTRAQIVTILWRLTGEPRAMKSNKFNDVSSAAYYDKAVSWAVEAGVVNGFDAKTFKPNDYVTREQLAAILYRYAEYMNLSTRGASNLTKYDDYYQIGTWARDAMAWANYHGLINGVSYSRIDPKGLATRAQVAAILHRFAVEFGNY